MSDANYKALRIEDLPRNLQPREMLKRVGPRHSSDDILLSVILRVGVPGANVVETAKHLLVAFGSLEALSRATCEEIVAKHVPGIGETKALQIIAAIEVGRRCSYAELMAAKKNDARYIHSSREIARGQRDEVALQPNLVFEAALKEGAKSVIISHNHPSGDPAPSEEDLMLTRKLVEAGRLMNIPVLDHLILASSPGVHRGFFGVAASDCLKGLFGR